MIFNKAIYSESYLIQANLISYSRRPIIFDDNHIIFGDFELFTGDLYDGKESSLCVVLNLLVYFTYCFCKRIIGIRKNLGSETHLSELGYLFPDLQFRVVLVRLSRIFVKCKGQLTGKTVEVIFPPANILLEG